MKAKKDPNMMSMSPNSEYSDSTAQFHQVPTHNAYMGNFTMMPNNYSVLTSNPMQQNNYQYAAAAGYIGAQVPPPSRGYSY